MILDIVLPTSYTGVSLPGASQVVIRDSFGQPVSVFIELENGNIAHYSAGDSNFRQILKNLGISVDNVSFQDTHVSIPKIR